MNKKLGLAAIAVGVTAMFVGCSDSPAESGSKALFEPKILKGTSAAVTWFDQSKGPLAPLAEKVKNLFETAKESCVGHDAKDFEEFLEKSGLKEAEFSWGTLTVGEIEKKERDAEPAIPRITLAVAVSHDAARIVSTVEELAKKDMADEFKFEKADFSGIAGWKIVNEKLFKELPPNVRPCFASIDGKLLLISSCADELNAQVGLYRDGAGASDSYGALCKKGNGIMRISLPDLGAQIAKFVDKETLENTIGETVPDGADIALNSKCLDSELSVSDDGKGISYTLRLVCAKDADAEKFHKTLQGLLNVALAKAKKQLKRDKDAAKALPVLDTVKLDCQGAAIVFSLKLTMSVIEDLIHVAEDGAAKTAKRSKDSACISNLKQIQAAVEQAMMSGTEKPTFADIIGEKKFIKTMPKCPGGGKYTIDYTNSEEGEIKCSVEGHKLPDWN